MDPNFPSNSHGPLSRGVKKNEVPEKVVEKIVTGGVIQKPKSLGRRFKELFIGDGSKGAMAYVFGDVLIPAIKNMLVDAVSKGAERAVYGNASPRGSRYGYTGQSRIQYSTPIDRGYSSRGRSVALPDQPPYRSGQRRQDAGEIILASRAEAELVLERLADLVNDYDAASVADLHELVGLPHTYVDNSWGWTSLGGSDIRQIREGFLLDLPPIEPLKT